MSFCMCRGTFHSALCCSCVMDIEIFLAHDADGWIAVCTLYIAAAIEVSMALVWRLDVEMYTSGWARLRASFAARSAASLPGIPMCEGIQAMTGVVCSCWAALLCLLNST